jgi:hypothetical protein
MKGGEDMSGYHRNAFDAAAEITAAFAGNSNFSSRNAGEDLAFVFKTVFDATLKAAEEFDEPKP